MAETYQVSQDKARKAYLDASPEVKLMLEQLMGDTIKMKPEIDLDSLVDTKACVEACGLKYEDHFSAEATKGMTDDEIAYREMKFIAQAYNQGWVPDFTDDNQRKWWPYFKYGSGVSLSLFTVGCDYSGTTVAPRLTFKLEAVCRKAVEKHFSVYKRYYENTK